MLEVARSEVEFEQTFHHVVVPMTLVVVEFVTLVPDHSVVVAPPGSSAYVVQAAAFDEVEVIVYGLLVYPEEADCEMYAAGPTWSVAGVVEVAVPLPA